MQADIEQEAIAIISDGGIKYILWGIELLNGCAGDEMDSSYQISFFNGNTTTAAIAISSESIFIFLARPARIMISVNNLSHHLIQCDQ